MKKIITLIIVTFAAFTTLQAQPRVSIDINIGAQPVWGPVGYDHVDYYYLPDIESYYSVPERVYVFKNGNHWVKSASLPARYRNFDLYRAHKVVINNNPEPYLRNNNYSNLYRQYRGKNDQVAIRDSRDEKYFENPSHPQHNQWNKKQASNNNRNNGNDRYDSRDKSRNDTRNDRYDNRNDNRTAQNNKSNRRG